MQLTHLLLIFVFTITLANAAPQGSYYKRDAEAEASNDKRDAEAWWDFVTSTLQ
ncbi:hypothetical protein RhiirA4_456176 [Rhizophagus irregularis]|uniref:Uncharacterized protein n=1 Tax=Rhizophagus irregularis TaxID=588596 RepID=A0A2I1G6Z2_9GLOM|nr:hypothetical protein RhiirA4_456176 [Rhizophagus irregularis]